MDRLKNGRRFMLVTPKGLIELTARFDDQFSTWLFVGANQEHLFKLGPEGELIPLVRDEATEAGSPGTQSAKYTIKDLNEWGDMY